MSTIAHDLTEKALAGVAGMMDAALAPPSPADEALSRYLLGDLRRQQIRRHVAESQRIAEACRLTKEWANGYVLHRSQEPTPEAYASAAIGFYNELATLGMPVTADPFIEIEGDRFRFHAESDGFFWNREIPVCQCGDELSRVNSRRVSGISSDSDGNPISIYCSCSASYTVNQ